MRSALAVMAVVALALPSAAQADTVVDTGTPTGSNDYSLNNSQRLGGYFTLNSATVINGVQGYISNFSPTDSVTATLYSDGAVPDDANILFATSFVVPGTAFQDYDWHGSTGLNWSVAAGNYWLGFSTDTFMTMLDGAPSPLSRYAFTNDTGWNRFDGLGIGVRVFDNLGAVPEPSAWALMILGFGAIGGTMRRKAKSHFQLNFS